MKNLIVIFMLVSTTAFGQLTIESAQQTLVTQYHIGGSTYLEQFVGHPGYGALVILTNDGGAAAFGSGDEGTMIYKADKTGKIQWKKKITDKGTEMETQGVAQDSKGNFYTIMLVYGAGTYRGGCERIVYVSKTGIVGWDKYIGTCGLANSPTVSYIHSLPDGRISLRGHIVIKKPEEGKDPTYNYWEGWINSTGVMTQKIGAVIDWKDESWKKLFAPE